MKWMRERDLLIAQTMAFVQSVTGKAPAVDKPVVTSGAFEPVDARMPSDAPAPIFVAAPTSDIKPGLADLTPATELPKLAPMARIDLRDDFRSEIRTRVANFRAHQEKLQPGARGLLQRHHGQGPHRPWRASGQRAARQIARGATRVAQHQLWPIFSSTGSRCFKNASGFSLIGKWPRPFMMVTSLPGMLLATASVSSGVQE